MSDGKGVWIRTDEISELIDNLAHLAFLMQAVPNDRSKWKWVIFALHNTMEGLFTCQLRGHDTSGVLILDKSSGKKLWTYLNDRNSGTAFPKERLAPFEELFKRVTSQECLPCENVLTKTEDREFSIKTLNLLRNKFDHFLP